MESGWELLRDSNEIPEVMPDSATQDEPAFCKGCLAEISDAEYDNNAGFCDECMEDKVSN